MEHTTRQHANLNDSCLLQTTDSDEYGGTAPFSEAEARIIKLIAENSPLRSFVNLHSGEFALYAPWDSQQKLAVGQPVGLAAAAARKCSLWAGLWVWDPFWPLLLPGEAHCGTSCWPLLLLRLPSSWHIGYLLGSAHAVFCYRSLFTSTKSQRGAYVGLVSLLKHCCWPQTRQPARGLQHF